MLIGEDVCRAVWLGGHKNINEEAHGGISVASYEGERDPKTRMQMVSHHVLFSTKKALPH